MRQECQVMLPEGICGKPSVDSVPDPAADDGRFWLCADHWDELNDSPDEFSDGEGTIVQQDTGYDDTDYDEEDEVEEDPEDDEEEDDEEARHLRVLRQTVPTA